MKIQLEENLFERYLTEDEQREEDEIVNKYLASIPTIGYLDSKGRLVLPKEEYDDWD